MAKLITSVLRAQIRMARPLLGKLDIEEARRYQDMLGTLGAKSLRGKVSYIEEPFELFDAAWAVPKQNPSSEGAVLYLHGGSYTSGTLAYAKGFGGLLAEHTGLRTLCVGYRLAPEHPYPAALDDAAEAYSRLLESCPPEKIVIAGESAGGGLIYALCLRLRETGKPMPSKIVAISPWTDLTFSGVTIRTNAECDPSLNEKSLRFSAGGYSADTPASDPHISPLFGDLRGLPPSLIFAGEQELLLSDSERLAKRLRDAGSECEIHVAEGMWHVYVLFGTSEADDAMKRICAFVAE